jgi:hypothetical protein
MKTRTNFILFTLGVLVVLLSGCSATGARFSGFAELPKDSAEVYIYRNGKFVGSAKPYEILVDGQKKASLKNAGYVKLLVTPGPHKIIAQPEVLQALSMASDAAETNLFVESRKRYFLIFSINSSVSGNTYYVSRNSLREVNEQSAVQALSELNYSE